MTLGLGFQMTNERIIRLPNDYSLSTNGKV